MKTTLLQSSDITGITFWLISMALLASTFFFFIERNSVKASWRTSMTLSGLVTGIAFVHYMYTYAVYEFLTYLCKKDSYIYSMWLIVQMIRTLTSVRQCLVIFRYQLRNAVHTIFSYSCLHMD